MYGIPHGVHEIFAGYVTHFRIRVLFSQAVRDRVKQMSLASARPTVEEQRTRRLSGSNSVSRRQGVTVRCRRNECCKCVVRVQSSR
jgi:hypothetical protein